MKKLNLGSGLDYKEGYVNLDIRKKFKADVYWDLNKFPYPFKANTFDEILAFEVLEHLDEPVEVMKEIWRIAKPNAIIKISVPYFSGSISLQDIEHKHAFGYSTFEAFEKGKLNDEFDLANNAEFKILKRKIIFSTHPFLKILNFIPNVAPKIYERFFAYIFPSQGLHVEMKVIKK